ncbi:MAG: QueT transporter family protein [Clostridium sp.]|jgi:uncharacterized membrane protein|nr:QueT transporter family protein [Clostridium sp.]
MKKQKEPSTSVFRPSNRPMATDSAPNPHPATRSSSTFAARKVAAAALIAALYIVLTYVAQSMGLASFAIQVRFSEALTILPYFLPMAIPGLFVGCFAANLLIGSMLLDTVFGSLATLVGALGTYALRKHKWLAPLPPIVANVIAVPLILQYVYGLEGGLGYFALTVGIGEILSCGVLGMLLLFALERHKTHFPW